MLAAERAARCALPTGYRARSAPANGVEQVLVTCDDDNLSSIAVIEACDGRLDCVIRPEAQAPLTRRYRID